MSARLALRFVLAAGLALAAPSPATAQSDGARDAPRGVRNVIFLLPDGFGPASLTMARELVGHPLRMDALVTGAVRTAARPDRVTDSAAGATAYACGIRTYNGAIAVDTLQRPCGTVLEAAERRGMATGLVATSRITHASPASFAAHVPYRGDEDAIAAQMARQGIDVIFGGGARHFAPEGGGGARTDGRDLLAELRADGYALAEDRAAFDALDRVPAAALLAPSHFAYELDRDPAREPSLAEMTRKALALLSPDPDGFFLFVEGSRIDHAAHQNDPAGHVHGVLAFDAALGVAVDWALADGHTLVVAAADHETGGMTLGRRLGGVNHYDWHPDYLAGVRASVAAMAARVAAGDDALAVLRAAGAADSLSTEEADRLAAAEAGGGLFAETVADVLADVVSARALVGWTTGGHTGVDVVLFAGGAGAEAFRGVLRNEEVGRRLAAALGLDLAPVTEALQAALSGPAED